jgi:hypothetical protein
MKLALFFAAVLLTSVCAVRKPAVAAAPAAQGKTRVATLDVQKVVLSSPDGLDAVAELQRLSSRLETLHSLEEARQKFDAEQKRLYKEITDNVMGIACEYAKRGRFAFVVDISDRKAPVVWQAGETEVTDITDELIELLKGQ